MTIDAFASQIFAFVDAEFGVNVLEDQQQANEAARVIGIVVAACRLCRLSDFAVAQIVAEVVDDHLHLDTDDTQAERLAVFIQGIEKP